MSLNISDFYLLFMWKLQPPEKSCPPLSQQPPSKSWDFVKKTQLHSSIHSEIRVPCPFFDHNHPKIIEVIFTSLNFDQLVKNQHSSAIYSCNTGDFRVSWCKRSHTHFWPSQPGNCYISWICITIKKINLHHH